MRQLLNKIRLDTKNKIKAEALIETLIVYISVAIIFGIFVIVMTEDTTSTLVLLTIITIMLIGIIPTEWKSACIRKEEIYEKEKAIFFLNSHINELIEIEIKNIESLKDYFLRDIIQTNSINLFIKKNKEEIILFIKNKEGLKEFYKIKDIDMFFDCFKIKN